MIRFTRVRATDCFAYGELDFKFEEGIHSISGTNGSSKSSIFCTVAQALYHQNPKGILMDDVSNSITGNLYCIEVWFSKGDKEYYVKDSKKQGKMEITENGRDISLKRIPDNLKLIEEILGCNYTEFIDIFYNCPESTMNLLDTKSDLERKKFINKVLRMSELDFHLDRMKSREKELSGKNGTIATLCNQIETLESAITEPQEELEPIQADHLEKVLTELRAELDSLKQEHAVKGETRRAATQKLEKARSAQAAADTLRRLEEELSAITPPEESEEALRERITRLNEAKAADAVRLSKCQDSIQRGLRFQADQSKIAILSEELGFIKVPEQTLEFCQENLTKLRFLQSTKEAERAQKGRERVSLHKSGSTGVCPTCGAGVDKDKFSKEVAVLDAECSALEELLTKCDSSIVKYTDWERAHQRRDKLQGEINRLLSNPDSGIDVDKAKAEAAEITSREDIRTAEFTFCEQALKVNKQRCELELMIVRTKGQLGEVVDAREAATFLEELDKRLFDLGEVIGSTASRILNLEQQIETARNHNAAASALKELNRQVEENNRVLRGKLEASRKEMQEAEETLELVKTWVGILGSKGYRVHKIERFLKSLNACMRKYSEIISNGSIQCHFFVDEEGKVDFTVTDSHKKIAWNCYSAGQKARVKLSCLFAVLELLEVIGSVSFNVFCMDEVFGRMDAAGMEGLFRVLEYSKGKGKSLYVIAHSELALPLTYTSTIRAEMLEDGTTRIVQ